jgi:long-chain fatty acid transport protein
MLFFTGSSLLGATEAGATNGMNLEGYGPIAMSLGGASFAYDNGTAAVMNNPATLSLVKNGFLLNVAFGNLGPDVAAIAQTPQGAISAGSLSDAFYMPALGFVMKRDLIATGIGVFSQGGMGTEYGSSSWLADPSGGDNSALERGLVNRSEVGVGRVIVPFAYEVNEKLGIGASFDVVWAGMDLQMALSEAQFQDIANPMAQTIGTASGSLVGAIGQFYQPFGGTGISRLYHAYFDFTDSSSLTGKAKGYGVAGKIGVVYKINEQVTFGATYHSETALGDLETDEAKLSMGVNADPGAFVGSPTGTYSDMSMELTGKVTVKDFQWPSMIGFGLAYRPIEKLMLAADLKWILWSGVMEDFKMTFTADDNPRNGGFAGLSMDAALFQEWENQFVIAMGAAFKPTDKATLRAGFNAGRNPVPDTFLNALFPAIVENHITFGGGYQITESLGIDFSMAKALESDGTNPGNGSTIPPVESTHGQLNWQVMLSNLF